MNLERDHVYSYAYLTVIPYLMPDIISVIVTYNTNLINL